MRSQKAIRGGRRSRTRPPRAKKKPRPKCPVSGKVAFQTEVDAKGALAAISRHAREKHPVRAYRCPDCSLWHLTSRS